MKSAFSAFFANLLLYFRKIAIRFVLSLRKISIKQRIIFAFLLISILPIAFLGIYSNSNYEKSITSKLNSYSGQLVQEISKNVKYETYQYEKLSETIIVNDDVQDGIVSFAALNDVQKNKLYETLSDKFSRELFNYKNVKNIILRFPDGSEFFDLGYEIVNEDEISRILSRTDAAIGNAYWTHIKTNQGTNCIVLSRVIYSKQHYLQKKGYVLIIIDERILAGDTYKNIDLGKGSELFIMNGDGVVISTAAAGKEIGKSFEDPELKDKLLENYRKNANTFLYHYSGGEYLIAGSFLPTLNWFIVGKIPYSFITSQSLEVRNAIVYASLVIILISLGLSIVIYVSVSMPLKSILAYAGKIRKGSLDEKISDGYNDEISELSFNIKIMVERLKALIDEVKVQQSRKRDAELKMLQAQINPHFLFNTLNSLKWSAMLSGNKTLEDGLGALSQLLRNTILDKKELISLEEELENLKNYAVIQRIRYANSFNLVFDIEAGLEKCRILKFILQPIVENSIIHGTYEDERQLEIAVAVKNVEDVLIIRVMDDGKGFEAGKVKPDGGKNKLSGIGLANVDERIKLNFGQGFGLTTKSAQGEGTVTDLIMPLIAGEEEDVVQGSDCR